jgi:opacity protein-like surface antigen
MAHEEDSMKFRSLVLSAALLISGVGTANASSTWLGIQGGAGVPTGDYGDVAVTGFQFGVLGTHMVNDQWGFGGDLNYHMFNSSDEVNAAAEVDFGPGSEIKWNTIQGTAHVVMNIPTRGGVNPYLKGGFGLYNLGIKLVSPSGDTSDSESKFGFNVGAGMNFASSGKMRWGVNAAYHIVSAEEDLGANVNVMTLGLNVLWGVGN